MHFFTQSSSSFRSTCPHQRSLFCCNINATSLTSHKSELIHTATSDTTELSCLCRVRFGGVNWIPDNSRLSPTVNLKSEHVSSNCPIHAATPDRHRQDCFVGNPLHTAEPDATQTRQFSNKTNTDPLTNTNITLVSVT